MAFWNILEMYFGLQRMMEKRSQPQSSLLAKGSSREVGDQGEDQNLEDGQRDVHHDMDNVEGVNHHSDVQSVDPDREVVTSIVQGRPIKLGMNKSKMKSPAQDPKKRNNNNMKIKALRVKRVFTPTQLISERKVARLTAKVKVKDKKESGMVVRET